MLGAHTAAVKRQMGSGKWTGRISTHGRRAAPARRRPPRPREADQGTGGAGRGLGPARAIPVPEELPDHCGIVQRRDQRQPAPAMRARQNIEAPASAG